jgi:hypothetical protein
MSTQTADLFLLEDLEDVRRTSELAGAGGVLLVPAEAVHAVRNVGNGSATQLATYVVDRGKPFLVVVE